MKRKGEEGYILVFICESAKLDQRKKAVKGISMEISTVFSCIALDEQSQRSYVLEQLKKEHLQMDADALRCVLSKERGLMRCASIQKSIS